MTELETGQNADRSQVEEELRRRNLLLNAINRVFREELTCESVADVARVCLSVAEELTGSAFGFLGQLNLRGRLDMTALSDPGWQACRVPETQALVMLRDMELRGIWSKAILQEESVIVNDPKSDLSRVGVPEGHPPITCFLGVPLKEAAKTVGLIGLANREGGYDENHRADIEALAVALVEALQRKQAEAELRKAHHELDTRVQRRTAELAMINTALKKEIVERKQVEQALRDSEQRFRTLVETTSDWVWEVDQDAVYTYVSPRVKDLLGYEPAEIIGTTPFDLMAPDEAECVAATFRRHVGNCEPIEWLENTNLHKEGHRVVLETSGIPVLDAAGQLLGYRGIDRDITQRKRAEERLAQTLKELQRSNADLQQFAYAASHDLQEPLRAIGGFIQLLQTHYQGKLDTKADEYIGFVVNGVARMQQLISDLLAYSRIRVDDDKPMKLVDANQAVAEAVANLEAAITEEGAEVSCEHLPAITGDRVQLTQLFQNLIGNAIKFHSEQPPRVCISAKRTDREWTFSVRDNGIGIAADFADRVFVLFQRLHQRTQYPGTGIGLAMCKRIVECHEGRIWFESEPGRGTTFRFTIPVEESLILNGSSRSSGQSSISG